jgi:hypothetical protein
LLKVAETSFSKLLLANAERRKNLAQQIIGSHCASNRSQLCVHVSQIFSQQLSCLIRLKMEKRVVKHILGALQAGDVPFSGAKRGGGAGIPEA